MRARTTTVVVSLLHLSVAGCGTASDGVSRGDAAVPFDASRSTSHDARADVPGHPRDATAEAPEASSRPEAGDDAPLGCGAACPTGYVCGTANGIAVCRAPSGVPLFSHIFVIVEENTSLATLTAAMTSNAAPSFESFRAKYASGSDYHGVSHPSLPNYIALTSGSTQGVGCDCLAEPGQGTCSALSCNLLVGSCSCAGPAMNLADQVEAASRTWKAFGEGMVTSCNLVDSSSTSYAVRHVPFLYYDDIQTNANRCNSHVVDYSLFDPASAPDLTYIAPNLIDDMHNPVPATEGNITSGDTWIGPTVTKIMASPAYQSGGLLVIVWDEDDGSGGITGTDDPIPIFVVSPYAKSGGYTSAADMDHYSLLATIEDGLGLARLGMAGTPRAGVADSLSDYFPAK
jgi:hypothetical protein